MKKLLTILTLALALCLLCSVAMADTVELTGDAYKDATQAVAAGAPASPVTITYKGTPVTLTWQNSSPAMKCLETRVLHYEGWYTSDKIFFDFAYTKPHTYDTTKVGTVLKKATCTEDALMSTVCTVCGVKVEYTYTGTDAAYLKKGHDYTKQDIFDAPTCEEAGEWQWVCSRCGKVDPDRKPQVIDAVGHDFVFNWIEEPNCISKGSVDYTCRHCGIEWNAFLKSNTPAVANVTTWRKNEVAKILGTKYTVQDALDESSSLWNKSLVNKFQWWNELSPDYKGHDFDAFVLYSAPTCGKNSQWIRWCPVCGEKQVLDNWRVNGYDDNTWNAPQYKITSKVRDGSCDKVVVTFKCALCDSKIHPVITVNLQNGKRNDTVTSLSKTEWAWIGMDPKEVATIDAHEYVINDTYKIGTFNPTCTVAGYTAYQCKYEYDEGTYTPTDYTINTDGSITAPGKHPAKKVETKPALGHDWGKGWIMQYAPGEYDNVNGYWLRTCARCGETENRISPYYPDACEKHDFEETVKTAATCTEDGVKVLTCKVCGYSEEKAISATGHDWDVTVKKAATCKEEGLNNRICKICGAAELDVKVPKLAHTWDEGKITKEATKEAKGEKTYTCTACGETKTEEVEYVITAAPDYTITVASYSNPVVTGKLEHVEDTLEADELFIRVTFFMNGNYYMSTMAEVEADGSFSIEGVGDIQYISIQARGTSSVTPEGEVYDAYEITF